MSPARVASLLVAVLAVSLAACEKRAAPPGPAPDAAASVAKADGETIVKGACLSCHEEAMLQQQRLGKEKWESEVKKMEGWGALVDADDHAALVDYLAAHYGPDAGAFDGGTIAASEAAAAIGKDDDGPYAGGDAARGKVVFASKCAACHGENARGQIGVDLVDRPILYKASVVATTVRRGRGKMLPIAASDAEIADVLAHLRALR